MRALTFFNLNVVRIGIIALTLGLASYAGCSFAQTPDKEREQFMRASAANFISEVKSFAKDPSSFVYKDVIYTNANSVCFLYNAKNSFGAYTGFTPVVVINVVPNGKAKYVYDAKAWNTYCANPKVMYTDITRYMAHRVK